MAKELFNRAKNMLDLDHRAEALHNAGTDDVPYSATKLKINTVGTGGNQKKLINFEVEGLDEHRTKTWHSKPISYQTYRKLKKLGIPDGTTRE